MEDYKDMTVNERKWRVGQFDAKTGSLVIKKLLPVVSKLFVSGDMESINIPKISMALSDIEDKDFEYIRDACLKVTHESLGAGFAPVLNENGTYGVNNIANSTMLVMTLVAHALIFNVTGFFADTPLASLVDKALNTFPPNSPT
jgi:hypothetical protein